MEHPQSGFKNETGFISVSVQFLVIIHWHFDVIVVAVMRVSEMIRLVFAVIAMYRSVKRCSKDCLLDRLPSPALPIAMAT
jgi:hypothetical protein